MLGISSHERFPLRQVKVEYIVCEGDHRYFVFHVVNIKGLAVATHHGVRLTAFLAVQLPAVLATEEVGWFKHLDLLLALYSRLTAVILVLLRCDGALLAFPLLYLALDLL